MKKIHNERKVDERKKFDATKFFFKQFIDLHASFKIYEFKKKFEKRLKNVKKFEIKYYDKRYKFHFYKIKNPMLLNFENIIFNRFSKKLDFKFYKLYKITSLVKKITYRLILFKTF